MFIHYLGTQSEVESCVSRIKRRFNEISLTPYDADKLKYASQENSSVGVDNSASQVLYPVPNISQVILVKDVFMASINISCVYYIALDVYCVVVILWMFIVYEVLSCLREVTVLHNQFPV